jgi:hypothetical protein
MICAPESLRLDFLGRYGRTRYSDILTKLRRVLIAAQFRADPQVDPTPEQIHATCLARADAAA